MEVQSGPNSIDEPNLLYKIQRKVKVFSTNDTLPNRGYNLVASSSKYGLVFVGVPTGTLSVYRLQQLIDRDSEPVHMTIGLPEKPTYLSVSCDHELLAVSGVQKLYIYQVMQIQNGRAQPNLTVNYDKSPESFVTAMQWNPCIPDSIALAFYDGTLFVYQASTSQVKKITAKARCICWSPKGKQLVTGNSDGTLHQFKPDLTPAKAFPAPNLFEGAPVEALAVYWISTFQFAVVYRNAADRSRPSVTIVNTPKGGQPTCLNYNDICFSTGSSRPWYYYLHGIAQWNIILSASSNSMELATIGSVDGANWLQWCQPDEARAELPLTDKKQENYPVGICIDSCAIHQLPWGENETLPHMPLLHVVSQSGLLTIFNLINLNNQAPQICSPPTQINLSADAFTSEIPGEDLKPPPLTQPVPEAKVQPIPVAVIPSQPTTQFPAMPTLQPTSQFGTTPPSSLFSIGQTTSQFGTTPPASQYGSTQQTSQFGLTQPASQFGGTQSSIFNKAVAPIKVPSFTPSAVPTPIPALEEKQEKPVAKPVQSNVAPLKPQPKPPSDPPKPQENAALKAEQEKITKAKANQELRNMLVKEVNDFQNELYNFMLKTRETQARIQKDIASINSNFNFNSLDTEQLKKECSIDELRSAIVQLKLELVRACAVIAEARSHSNAREFHQWTQADPLTTKRVASIKKLTYYVQTQLDQAQKALDYKWSEASKDSSGPGKRMIRPILDDVYQPLVKQQEILSRQQAVLRTLRKTLSECDVGPAFKSSSLLRSTPFRNKDPLSKLTKNILNMSIEPQNPKQAKGRLSMQKLEILKDALTNHKMVRIKPVNVEMRPNFVSMKEQYDRILKEKIAEVLARSDKTDPAQIVNQADPPRPVVQYPAPAQPKVEMKQEVKQPIVVPAFTPQSNVKPAPFANVARTLFTDEPKQELPRSQPQEPIKPFSFSKTVLKELLQNKSQANSFTEESPNTSQTNLPDNSDANNLFMGQKICSPFGLSRSSAPTPASPPSAVFTSKPISEMTNMCTKLPAPPFDPKTSAFDLKTSAFDKTSPFRPKTPPSPTLEAKTAPKPIEKTKQEPKPKIQSETGEPEPNEPPKTELKPTKPMTNLFGMKPAAASTPIPDVVKTTSQEKATIKPIDKLPERSKENVPKVEDVKTQREKKEVKPLGAQTANKVVFGSSNSTPTEPKALDLKSESKPSESSTEKTEKVVASETKVTLTIATSKSSAFATPTSTTPKEPSPPKSEDKPAESKSSVASLFSAAAATQPKSEESFSQGSMFTTNQPTAFGEKSAFGTNNLTFGQTPETSASVFTASSVPSDVSITSTANSETEAPIAVSATITSVFDSTLESNGVVTSSSAFSTTPTSVFGKASGAFAPTSTSLFPATSAPAFGQPAFGTTTQASVFETTSTASSVFGAANQAFGSITPTKPTGSIFGSPTTQASVFGATSTPSLFGAPTTQTSVFGAPTQTTQSSVFGAQTTTTQSSAFGTQSTQASMFGITQSTQASVFGSPPQTTQASVFGSPTQTTQASVFGTPTPTTQASIFGTPTQTTQTSVFGTPTQTTQASVFGTPTQTSQASIFGTPTQTTQASIFGTPTQTTQASVFGGSASSGSLFGGGEANLFAAASISTTSAPTGTSGGSIFGASTGGSVFGGSGGGNIFGSKAAAFGQSNNSAASIFGGATSFGDKAAPNLWAGGNSNTAFGSTGFGQQTTQQASIFGGGGSFSAPSAGAFSSPQQTNAFGTGDSQPASVFGTPQQQSAPAFGGSPGFGSKPAFGQTAGFGSPTNTGGGFGGFGGGFNKSPSGFGAPAAFGGGATFGGNAFGNTSPGKAFGGAPATGFGSPTQQSNATFENLAGQNTLTFGSLAQAPQQQQQPSFNSSPQFSSWRG